MFYYFKPRPMKRFIILTIALAASLKSVSQTISSRATYQPMTFEELAQPLLMHQQAYNRAEEQCYSFYEKALEAMESEKYTIAENYLKQCIRINNKFRGEIIDNDELYELLSTCQATNRIQSRKTQSATTNFATQQAIVHEHIYSPQACPKGWTTRRWNGNVYYTPSENINCRINNITRTKESIIVEFEYSNLDSVEQWSFNRDTYTYIKSLSSGLHYAMQHIEGAPLSPFTHDFEKVGDSLIFRIYFKAVPANLLRNGIDIYLMQDKKLQFKIPYFVL